MRNKVELFKVMSEKNRIRILLMLMEKSLCVCEITSILELSTATVSKHLSYLRDKGFIDDVKDGKWINYKIKDNPEDEIVREILKLLPDWFQDEEIIVKDKERVRVANRYQILNISI